MGFKDIDREVLENYHEYLRFIAIGEVLLEKGYDATMPEVSKYFENCKEFLDKHLGYVGDKSFTYTDVEKQCESHTVSALKGLLRRLYSAEDKFKISLDLEDVWLRVRLCLYSKGVIGNSNPYFEFPAFTGEFITVFINNFQYSPYIICQLYKSLYRAELAYGAFMGATSCDIDILTFEERVKGWKLYESCKDVWATFLTADLSKAPKVCVKRIVLCKDEEDIVEELNKLVDIGVVELKYKLQKDRRHRNKSAGI